MPVYHTADIFDASQSSGSHVLLLFAAISVPAVLRKSELAYLLLCVRNMNFTANKHSQRLKVLFCKEERSTVPAKRMNFRALL